MAQGGSKSRIIIWAVVGVLVVVAAILLLTKPKDNSKSKLVPENFAERKAKEVAKLQDKVAQAGLSAEQVAAIDAEIVKANDALSRIEGVTDRVERRKIADEYHLAYGTAKRLYKDATGQEAGGDEGGD
jgi:FMN-dependent NADH-azoreductase